MHESSCQSHAVELQASQASGFIQVHSPLVRILGIDSALGLNTQTPHFMIFLRESATASHTQTY